MISHKRRASGAAGFGLAAGFLVFGTVPLRAAGPPLPDANRPTSPSASPPTSPRGPTEGDRLFSRLLARSRSVQDFRARFTQTLSSRGLATPTEESGTVFYMRPGRMRWEYEVPEKKLAVSDGKTGWLHLPEENRAVRMDLTESVAAGPIADLLAGNDAALPAFRATALPERDGLVGVRLVPVTPRDEFEEIELRAEAGNLRMASVEVVDPGGNRMLFRFGGMAENTGLPASLFVFEPPPGTRIDQP